MSEYIEHTLVLHERKFPAYSWWIIRCPGCKKNHVLEVGTPVGWGFNGDVNSPTFTPSLLVYPHKGNPPQPRCHSFITAGKIQFLADCEHSLAGQAVDLDPITDLIFSK